MNNKKGFTLVELLAVIVILAIILIIAVPQIMKTIDQARKGTFESNAKLIAGMAEKKALENETLGITDRVTCEQVAKLNTTDYESCTIKVVDGEAKVNIVGKGKFEGMNICSGTKTNALVTNEACSTDEACFVYTTRIPEYEVKDYDSCVSYMRDKIVVGSGHREEELQSFCRGEVYRGYTFSENIEIFIENGYYTERELIRNNVIKDPAPYEVKDYDSCVSYMRTFFTDPDGVTYEEGLQSFCRGESPDPDATFSELINALIENGTFTEQELIENNVIKNPITSLTSTAAKITGYDIACGTDVVVPKTISGLAVTTIGRNAFYEKNITSVKLPSSIMSIGSIAFAHNNITEIDFSSLTNLTTIGESAFEWNQITSVKLPSSVTSIGGFAFYSSPQSLSNVNLGNTSATIGNCAFNDAEDIENHNLPNTYECIIIST